MIYNNIKELFKEYIIDKMLGGIEFRGKIGDEVKIYCYFWFKFDNSIDFIWRIFIRNMMDKYDDYRKKSYVYYLKVKYV